MHQLAHILQTNTDGLNKVVILRIQKLLKLAPGWSCFGQCQHPMSAVFSLLLRWLENSELLTGHHPMLLSRRTGATLPHYRTQVEAPGSQALLQVPLCKQSSACWIPTYVTGFPNTGSVQDRLKGTQAPWILALKNSLMTIFCCFKFNNFSFSLGN